MDRLMKPEHKRCSGYYEWLILNPVNRLIYGGGSGATLGTF
jgi:hypothetical protein